MVSKPFLRLVAVATLFTALFENVAAAESCSNNVGKLVSIEGVVEIDHAGEGKWRPATLASSLCQDDMIHAGENSRATLSLINDVVLRLDQNTTMRLVDVAPQPEKRSLLELVVGAFKSFSRPPRTLAVNTPYVNGLIEGTEFAMRVDKDSTWVSVYEGKVSAVNDYGKMALKRGESALAKTGRAPQPYMLVKPGDAIQWTLHFPPLLAVLGGGRQIPAGLSPAVGNALSLSVGVNTATALALLKQVPASEQNVDYFLYRSALYLDVGRAAEARADIQTALAKNPNSGLAYALQSIIEIVNNDREQALASAEKAVALSPSSSAAKIALSYAQQAAFNLDAARDTLLSAVGTNPDDALVWARLGELWLMFGEHAKALEAARKAEALAPQLARTQTVLGFTALAENREADAKTAFQTAVKLDSADPLAHFGLGLTKIKAGALTEGRKDIEAAVAIDSSNALLRSYLGKAYYEEKRDPLEDHQYGIAKELDPADPTPYLYSAISKQTLNRPVEALHDLQKAIELNNNRAVYRSRQLLDSDLAARSASLGRVYSDLGFQQLALREGWKSVNTDNSSFSAHRLLADAYSVQPRHEIARVSELLQSQLLQPLSMTPIQPRLAESNLFLVSAGGPGALSFNEFNPIFNRNGLTIQGNSLIGENDTYAGEGIVSGIYKNVAFSFGGFHYTSDGFRKNADQHDDIANAFLQYELSPNTSIQGEYRYRDTEKGDQLLRFFPENFFTAQRNKEIRHTYRLGLRHNFTPNSIVIGSYTYQDDELHQTDADFPFFGRPPGFLLDQQLHDPRRRATGGELQHLFRSHYVNLTSGVGYFDVNGLINQALTLTDPFFFQIQNSNTEFIIHHLNLYTYAQINLIKHLTATLGASYDTLSGDFPGENVKQFNPKFGLTWEPVKGTTLRGALFRSLKRTLVTQQTLEPTQVAGFNQFFDDYNQTESWRYGGALDQKFTKNLFGGVEYSRRNLSVPFLEFNDLGSTARSAGWKEELGRVYLFWTPHDWLAVRGEYQYERLKRGDSFPEGVSKADTHKFPLGVNFFHPSGFGAMLSATYYNQQGIFGNYTATGDPVLSGRDDFWLIDAAFKYRLPKRYGFIAMGATNLFDRKFNYYDSDLNNASIQPDRMYFARVTLAIP